MQKWLPLYQRERLQLQPSPRDQGALIVFASRGWARFALFCNLLGTICLFLSFQATSSSLRLVTTSNGSTALCVDGNLLISSVPGLSGFGVGGPCPEWERARPAAVVTIEHPILITLGFVLTSFGFLLQFLSIPSPKTIAQIRADLKAAKLQQRVKHNPAQG